MPKVIQLILRNPDLFGSRIQALNYSGLFDLLKTEIMLLIAENLRKPMFYKDLQSSFHHNVRSPPALSSPLRPLS